MICSYSKRKKSHNRKKKENMNNRIQTFQRWELKLLFQRAQNQDCYSFLQLLSVPQLLKNCSKTRISFLDLELRNLYHLADYLKIFQGIVVFVFLNFKFPTLTVSKLWYFHSLEAEKELPKFYQINKQTKGF